MRFPLEGIVELACIMLGTPQICPAGTKKLHSRDRGGRHEEYRCITARKKGRTSRAQLPSALP